MTDQLLSILKVALLLVLYLFFARVLWAVWNEVRLPAMHRSTRPPDATIRPPSGAIPGAVKVDRPYRVTHMKVVAPAHLKGFTFTVNESGYTIGRSEDNDLSIGDDEFASTHHARVTLNEGLTTVEDLSSTNGTFVNNERITDKVLLQIGDRLQIGRVIIEASK